ncbi:NAD-dependent epimerase/dehydratase family protein [Parvibaculum sp.]|uniref:NAD-dependent epimerase/dehydratase family protein n=1 Tax=Parvibaculum sp. TaxID=2024848 RepID=UPI001B07753F|nr:NAD-dependent epimerase/dehydratase family protein [Parvibaculum sp.]MBO6634026.1 NAD-dependent epimerase/dehydratase family protein [Parvibaculum sp.]MBO6678920.1 NAD-dependent epimerase/dehydratase family protein [Parvibaculum sp.]MBO6685530.1 NAD-dependent epimerase/dehydratase family protein [Parvibaculum sp.]MBO6906320.1 NAD-dependent epimerase/dehydratase family protein [Parvibaculum sp.]
MMVRWITPLLGTTSASQIEPASDMTVIDVRELVDRAGNATNILRDKITAAAASLGDGRKTVICCDHGISRSNAVAAGVLSQTEGISFESAIRRVIAATGESEMRPEVVEAVRRSLPSTADKDLPVLDRERWLLTGGSGALGGLIAATAPGDIEILYPSRQELDLLHGAVPVGLYAAEAGVSRILHFAAPRISNTNTAVGEALTMLRNVLEVASIQRLPVVMPSRWEVFGGYRGETMEATEETPSRPAGALGDTKHLLETLALTWTAQQQANVTILRSGLVFGDDIAPNFMRAFVRKACIGETIITHVYDNGEPLLDLMTAEDWASAFWALVRSGETGLFQAGGGALTGTRQIAAMAAAAAGQGCQISELHVEGKAANVRLGFGKLEEAVGWRPSRPAVDLLADFLSRACDDRTYAEKGR